MYKYFVTLASALMFYLPNVTHGVLVDLPMLNQLYAPDTLPWTQLDELAHANYVEINHTKYYKDVSEHEYVDTVRYPGQNLQAFARPTRHQVDYIPGDEYLHLTYKWMGTGASLGLGKTYYIKIKTKLMKETQDGLDLYVNRHKYIDDVKYKLSQLSMVRGHEDVAQRVNGELTIIKGTKDLNFLVQSKKAIDSLLASTGIRFRPD